MKLLLAEDEVELAKAVKALLEHYEYDVDAVYNGEEAVQSARLNVYDCIILDVMMPVKNGIEALKEIRMSGNVTPIIMLTAKSEIDNRVEGLDAGADDYVTKPFAIKELLARIASVIRRNSTFTPRRLSAGSVTLDLDEQELTGSNSIRLAKRESRLMEILMLNFEKEMSTSELFSMVWDDEPETDAEIVWVYVSYLREKLDAIRADLKISGQKDGNFALQMA